MLLASVRTEVGFWDTGDLQTVAWIAGIPYPTGFPGYVLVGWLWTHLIPLGSVAARLNALSALALAGGAATVAALALLFEAAAGGRGAGRLGVRLRAPGLAARRPTPTRTRSASRSPSPRSRWRCAGAGAASARALVRAIVLGGAALALDNTTVLILAGGAGRGAGPAPAAARRGGRGWRSRCWSSPARTPGCRCAARRSPRPAPIRPWRSASRPAGRSGTTTTRAGRPGFVRLVTGSDWGPGRRRRPRCSRRAALGAAWAPLRRRAGGRSARRAAVAGADRAGLRRRAARRWPRSGLALAGGCCRRCSAARTPPRPIPSATCSRSTRCWRSALAVAADRTIRAFAHERAARRARGRGRARCWRWRRARRRARARHRRRARRRAAPRSWRTGSCARRATARWWSRLGRRHAAGLPRLRRARPGRGGSSSARCRDDSATFRALAAHAPGRRSSAKRRRRRTASAARLPGGRDREVCEIHAPESPTVRDAPSDERDHRRAAGRDRRAAGRARARHAVRQLRALRRRAAARAALHCASGRGPRSTRCSSRASATSSTTPCRAC